MAFCYASRHVFDRSQKVIPEPRCLKNIQSGVAKGRYKEAKDVYTDLSLVFWNALFYNEAGSQIAIDAALLKVRQSLILSGV